MCNTAEYLTAVMQEVAKDVGLTHDITLCVVIENNEIDDPRDTKKRHVDEHNLSISCVPSDSEFASSCLSKFEVGQNSIQEDTRYEIETYGSGDYKVLCAIRTSASAEKAAMITLAGHRAFSQWLQNQISSDKFSMGDVIIFSGTSIETGELTDVEAEVVEVGAFSSPTNNMVMVLGYKLRYADGQIDWMSTFIADMVGKLKS